MMSCKEVTHLLSQQQERKLSSTETLTLRVHLMMCSGCANFSSNMTFMRKLCERFEIDTKKE
jgi:predicted anti-sigma-YlaC factor YlaD